MHILNRIVTVTLLLASVALTLASCTNNPYGIFQSIEDERKIVKDRNLGDGINVSGFAKAANHYFLSAGALYWRKVDETTDTSSPQWATLDLPADIGSDPVATAVVAADLGGGERVYVLVVASATGGSTVSGVYVYNPSSSDPAPSATALLSNNGSIKSIVDLFVVTDSSGPWLIMSVQGTGGVSDYRLYGSQDGSSTTEISGATSLTPFADAASDNTKVAYMSATTLLVDSDGIEAGSAPVASSPGRGASASYSGVFYEDTMGMLWLADDSGYLYRSVNFGTDWTKSADANTTTSSGSTAIPFTDFAAFPNYDGSAVTLVVGTVGYGYRELGDVTTATTQTAASAPDESGSNYQASDLAKAAIGGFFVDPTAQASFPVPTSNGETVDHSGRIVFAETSSTGLWRALSDDDPIQWVRE